MTERKSLKNYGSGAPFDDRDTDLHVQTVNEAVEKIYLDNVKPAESDIDALQAAVALLQAVTFATVADLTALKAVASVSLRNGCLYYCRTLGLYVYNSASTATADDVAVVTPTAAGSGAGRFIRLSKTSLAHTHASDAEGGNIAQSSVTGLVAALAAAAPLVTERHTGTVTTADDVATEVVYVGIEEGKAYDINVKVVGFLSDGDVAYSAEVAVAARRKTGGNATVAGTLTELHAKGDAGASAWAVTAVADTIAQHIKIKVTGSQKITEAGDSGNQLASWNVVGVTAANSDNYVLYYALSDSAGDRTVSLFADDAGVTKVAEGMRTGDGVVTLSAVGHSGVSGSVDVTYSGDIAVGEGKTLTFKTINWAATATATEVSI